MGKSEKKYAFALILILILAFFLRFYKSNIMDLYADDAFSWFLSRQTPQDILKFIYDIDAHPPLFYFFLHFWTKLGTSPLIMRLPGIFLGTFSLIGVYLLGKELVNEKLGIMAAFLTAVSASCVYMSKEIRMYPYLSFFVIFGFYFFVKLFDGVQRTAYGVQRSDDETRYAVRSTRYGYWLLYTLFTVMSWYLHYFGIIVTVSQNIIVLLLRRRINIKYWIWSQLIILICYLPWYKYFLHHIVYRSAPEANVAFLCKINSFVYMMLWNFTSLYVGLPKEYLFNFLLFIVFIGVFVVCFYNYKNNGFFLAVVFIGFFTQLALMVLKAVFTESMWIHPRYFYYLLPIFFLGVAGSFIKKDRVKLFFGVIILLIFLSFNITALYNIYYVKGYTLQRWSEATSYLDKYYKPDDGIIVLCAYQTFAFNYYFRRPHSEYSLTGGEEYKLKDIFKKHKRVWLVTSFSKIGDPDNKIIKHIAQNHKFIQGLKLESIVQQDAAVTVVLIERGAL